MGELQTVLTQLTTVKERLGILPGDTQFDTLLTRCIQGVSARFDRECGRTFARTAGATTEFEGRAREVLAPCYPLESITKFEVKERESGGWVEQTGVEYLVRSGCVISLEAPLSLLVGAVARVTYAGGFVLPGSAPGPGQTALPSDLEQAATEQVATWFSNRERVGLFRHWPNAGTYVVLSQQPLLPSVAAVLRRHQRWVA